MDGGRWLVKEALELEAVGGCGEPGGVRAGDEVAEGVAQQGDGLAADRSEVFIAQAEDVKLVGDNRQFAVGVAWLRCGSTRRRR
jgi:hypothetical protein